MTQFELKQFEPTLFVQKTETVRARRIDGLARRARRIAPLLAVLALGLTLSACDKCGTFFWEKQSGACKASPTPN